jgi:hypothetical protein
VDLETAEPTMNRLFNEGTRMRSLAAPRRLPLFALALLSLTVAACSGSSTAATSTTAPTATTTTTTTTSALTTETFTGSVGQNGSAIHPFTVVTGGYTVLAGFTSIAPSTLTSLGLGIGVWDAASSTCGLNAMQSDAAKSGSTAISGTATAGNYCIRVYDGGNLTAGVTANYIVQVQHY